MHSREKQGFWRVWKSGLNTLVRKTSKQKTQQNQPLSSASTTSLKLCPYKLQWKIRMNQDLERITRTSGIDKAWELILKALCLVLLSTLVLVILVRKVSSSKSPSTVCCSHENKFWAAYVCVQVHVQGWADSFVLVHNICHPSKSRLLWTSVLWADASSASPYFLVWGSIPQRKALTHLAHRWVTQPCCKGSRMAPVAAQSSCQQLRARQRGGMETGTMAWILCKFVCGDKLIYSQAIRVENS